MYGEFLKEYISFVDVVGFQASLLHWLSSLCEVYNSTLHCTFKLLAKRSCTLFTNLGKWERTLKNINGIVQTIHIVNTSKIFPSM